MDFKNFISSFGTSLTKEKGQHVFSQGESDRHIYFIQQGLLKAYYISSEGKEFVKSFLMEGSSIASVSSYISSVPAPFSVVALEDTSLLRVSFDDIYAESKKSNQIAMRVIDILLQLAQKKEKREFEFLCLSPEERYRLVIAQSPDLLTRITQNDLAKYLGITPIGLSRIKKRVVSP